MTRASFGLLFALGVVSPQQPAPAPALHYDVVSIHESRPDPAGYVVGSKGDVHGSRLDIQNYDYGNLLDSAFGINPYQLDELPKPVDTRALFTMHLSGSEETDAALKAMNDDEAEHAREQMLQEVLTQRFHLQYHWTTREMPSFLLVASKQNRMQASAVKPLPPGVKPSWKKEDLTQPWYGMSCDQKGCTIEARGQSMEWLGQMLGYQLHGPTVDRTNLSGLWDFKLQWSNGGPAATADEAPYPPLEVAVAEQLGLRIDHGKAPLKMLVVDHIEPPTPN